ncbi:MAG: hypothetical protein QM831_18110 [Kofleriaceae bacterium]
MRALAFALLAACGTNSPEGVTGPFTGETRRFVIDQYMLPTSSSQASAYADDLNGDGYPENELGQTFAFLGQFDDLAQSPDAMRSAGQLPTTFEIQADDFVTDSTVGASFIGKPGDSAIAMGGTFVNGVLATNRTKTSLGGEGSLVLPVLADADPLTFALHDSELDLRPDGDGYVGEIRGFVDPDEALAITTAGVAQMINSNPRAHGPLGNQLDTNHDQVVTAEEAGANPLITAVVYPDVTFRGRKWLSFGIGVHLIPCADGLCAPVEIADRCQDRVKDGDETDVDCGGGCHPCGEAQQCLVATDCDSLACTASGTCSRPTCGDQQRDGFEDGVDCGFDTCGYCPGTLCVTETMTVDPDLCASRVCNQETTRCE